MIGLRTVAIGVGMLVAAIPAGWGTAIAAEPVTIAMAGPLSGQNAAMGEQQRRGVELAAADLNAAGGLLGRQVTVIAGDDACEPKQAVALANRYAGAGVGVVIGHFCSSSSIPASRVYHEENIIQITPASTNPALTEQGFSNVFRVCGRDDQQGAVAGAFLADRFHDRAIAIIHDKTAYGTGLAAETRAALARSGVVPKLDEAYVGGEKDYSALVARLKHAAVEVVYIGGYYTEAGLIVRQMRDQGLTSLVVSGDGLISNEYWAITGPAGEGTLMTFNPDPRKRPDAQGLVARFREAGFEPEGYTLYSYAAVQVYAEAVRRAGSLRPDAVAGAIHGGTFDTVVGPLGFDARGDITTPAYVWFEWHDGQYRELDRP
ncbi:MAG: ABC transporter substrate-binding protein [Azospirillum sp.]|nr:ABC transporter substrate-binding protein [Azospirillum sp.]